jgi:hypothetical protein
LDWTAVNARLSDLDAETRADVLACLEAIETGAMQGLAERREREAD